MRRTYSHTRCAAYLGFVTQAIVNNFAPLLFVRFSDTFGMKLDVLSMLITVNFVTQMVIDYSSTKFVKPLGLRRCCVLAHVLSALGLVLYAILPFAMDPLAGILIADIVCAIGGGLDEVVISPVVEAIPGDQKASSMAMLHSFYCWGQVGVVAISTILFACFGLDCWPYVSLGWAVIPAADAVMFAFVPICELNEGHEDTPLGTLLRDKRFILFLVVMVCAGASELGMSQWASLFAEVGLHVSKPVGDLLGPCAFAVLMGLSRTIYGVWGSRLNLAKCIVGSGVLCVAAYMIAIFVPNPFIALLGCALCGLSVGLMWPGTYSMASATFPRGGAAMFSILALAGDIGCTSGPTIAGLVGNAAGDIKLGLLVTSGFPLILAVCVACMMMRAKRADISTERLG